MPDTPADTPDKPATPALPLLLTKHFDTAEINFTPGERSMVAWITTDHVDLEGDVVIPSGVDYRSFIEDNPVVMAVHDYGRWPVGQCQWIKPKRGSGFNGLVAKNDFDEDADSEVVWSKVKRRTVRSVSIGFLPPADLAKGEWGPPTAEELKRRPDWSKARRIIRRCLLKEYSICPIGMNPAALVLAIGKGMHKPVFIPAEETIMAETEKTTEEATAKEASAITAKDDDGDSDMETESLSPGMHVKMPGEAVCGVVKAVHTEGDHVSDGDESGLRFRAAKDFPVASVDLHDADHKPTGKMVVCGVKDLEAMGEPAEKAKAATVETPASDLTTAKDLAEGSGTSGGFTTKPVDADGDDDGDTADADSTSLPIKTHDPVKVTAPHHKGYGVVKSVHTCGLVPDVDEDMRGSHDNPAARVKCYKAMGDGFVPTDHHVAARFSHLEKVGPLPGPSKAGKSKAVVGNAATASDSQPATPSPLPPLVPFTPEQSLARLTKAFDPDALEAMVAHQLDRMLGAV